MVLTPHNEAVRSEFGRAFRDHMARQGRSVEVDWRTPGGTAEIARYLTAEYAASFQLYWTRHARAPLVAGDRRRLHADPQ